VPLPGPAKAIGTGGTYSLAVAVDGAVWAWGDNFHGQLGDGTTVQRASPVQAVGLRGIIAVAAGDFHTLALDEEGSIWSLGENLYAQLGDGTAHMRREEPARVLEAAGQPLRGVAAVATGPYYSLALMRDGTVRAWGDIPSSGGHPRSDVRYPVPVAGLRGSTALAAGLRHGLALGSDGTVLAWGANHAGQLGDGSTTARFAPAPVQDGGGRGWAASPRSRRTGTATWR
jgi:alpha-tubulin suppressor-like RCC1 family protein